MCKACDRLDKEEADEQIGRFKLWATHHNATDIGMASLDYQLRLDPQARSAIDGILEVIISRTKQAINYLKSNEPEDTIELDTLFSSWMTRNDEEQSAFTSTGNDEHRSMSKKSSISSKVMESLSKSITRLLRLSVAHREAGPTRAFTRLLVQEKEDTKSFRPQARNVQDHTTYQDMPFKNLVERTLSHDYSNLSDELKAAITRVSVARKQAFDNLLLAQEDQLPTVETVTTSTTEAAEDSRSIESGILAARAGFRFPRTPVIPIESKEMRCPLCLWVLPRIWLTKSQFWKLHIESDLQPYMCLHEHCLDLPRLFSSKDLWIAHAKEQHSERWICPICEREQREAFSEDHFKKQHGIAMSSHQLFTMSQRAKRLEIPESISTCPFCDQCKWERSTETRTHRIASHLLEIAILSVTPTVRDNSKGEGQHLELSFLHDRQIHPLTHFRQGSWTETGSYQSQSTYESPELSPTHNKRRESSTGKEQMRQQSVELHHEPLDLFYNVKPREYFQVGRMFHVQYTQPAGSVNPTIYSHDDILLVTTNTQIKLFVVVRIKSSFCFACPVFTYSGMATTKPGIIPREHAVIYSDNSSPQLLQGETGITKDPIMVYRADEDAEPLDPCSRIYFGIHYPVHYNMKVRNIGMVCAGDVPKVIRYFQEHS